MASPATGYLKRPQNKQADRGAPGKIRCFVNGEWKDRSEFSGRQLEKFKRSGASASNSQISCREHTAQVRRELKCEGPCGDWYPIETFSRSTRSHNKTWCLHCTEWQLSVEPGYAPFNPPVAVDEEEELDDEVQPIEGGSGEPSSQDTANRIMNWIEHNPDEVHDFEAPTASTVTAGGLRTSSAVVTSILDSPITELEFLPVALSAANAVATPPSHPTYASVTSTAADSEMLPGLRDRRMGPAPGAASGRMAGSGLPPQRPPATQSTVSGTTTRAPTQNQSVVSPPVQDIAWVEDEFSALAIVENASSATVSGWARPLGRRTDLVTPRYVANSRGIDNQPLSIQRVTYAEEDDDSGDEC